MIAALGRPVGALRRRLDGAALVVPALLLLVVGFLVPLAFLLPQSVQDPDFGLEAYSRLFGDSVYLGIVRSTARIAITSTALCIAFGYPMALWISRLGSKGRALAMIAVILPFWVSILVRTYSWVVILGKEGMVNEGLLKFGVINNPISFLYEEKSVLIGTVNILAPFFILPMVASMTAIDTKLVDAARSLGASRFQSFWRVFFPQTIPALIAGTFLIFILTFGFYVTPSVLGGGRVQMLSTLLDYLVNTSADWPLAAALSMFLLLGTLFIYLLTRLATVLSHNRGRVQP